MPDKSEDDDALKKKFQQLQLQQQQKLERRKIKKQQNQEKANTQNSFTPHSAENGKISVDNEKTTASAFGVQDELDLKIEDPVPKSSSYLSAELVEHLNEQIRELKDENSRLFKLLGERDYEIRQLKRKREEDKIALTGSSGLSADTAAAKIVELSKKVRELNATLETKKTEAKQLFGRCRHLENEVAKMKADTTTPRISSVMPADDVSPRSRNIVDMETKNLSEKLRISEQRNAEYRNQVQSLKNDLKMAQKVITNEVGEGVNFHDLLNANSQWRGRAQQILGLQKKVGEMKSLLEHQAPLQSSRSTVDQFGDRDLEDEFMGAKQSKGADMKHREVLRKLEREKKDQQEKASAELKALESDFAKFKQKLEGSKARNKVLAKENQSIKAEMQKLIEKGTHDDELITALIAQQANMKSVIDQLTEMQKQQQNSQQHQSTAATAKIQQENNVIQQLKGIVSEKEGKVRQLEQELLQLKQAKMQESQMNSVNALFERSQSARSEIDTDRRPATSSGALPDYEGEGQSSKLTPSPPLMAAPSSAGGRNYSRHSSAKGAPNGMTSTKPRSSSGHRRTGSGVSGSRSRKGSRPSTSKNGVDEEREELERQCQEYRSLAQAAEVERDKLMDLIKVLQKRLNDTNEQTLQFQNEMKVHKQNAVKLEKLIGKMRLESNKASAGVQKRREKSTMSFGSTSDLRSALSLERSQDLEGELALQKDENEALKAALESTLKAKEEDLKIYNEMVDQTKLVFLQGLRQLRAKAN